MYSFLKKYASSLPFFLLFATATLRASYENEAKVNEENEETITVTIHLLPSAKAINKANEKSFVLKGLVPKKDRLLRKSIRALIASQKNNFYPNPKFIFLFNDEAKKKDFRAQERTKEVTFYMAYGLPITLKLTDDKADDITFYLPQGLGNDFEYLTHGLQKWAKAHQLPPLQVKDLWVTNSFGGNGTPLDKNFKLNPKQENLYLTLKDFDIPEDEAAEEVSILFPIDNIKGKSIVTLKKPLKLDLSYETKKQIKDIYYDGDGVIPRRFILHSAYVKLRKHTKENIKKGDIRPLSLISSPKSLLRNTEAHHKEYISVEAESELWLTCQPVLTYTFLQDEKLKPTHIYILNLNASTFADYFNALDKSFRMQYQERFFLGKNGQLFPFRNSLKIKDFLDNHHLTIFIGSKASIYPFVRNKLGKPFSLYSTHHWEKNKRFQIRTTAQLRQRIAQALPKYANLKQMHLYIDSENLAPFLFVKFGNAPPYHTNYYLKYGLEVSIFINSPAQPTATFILPNGLGKRIKSIFSSSGYWENLDLAIKEWEKNYNTNVISKGKDLFSQQFKNGKVLFTNLNELKNAPNGSIFQLYSTQAKNRILEKQASAFKIFNQNTLQKETQIVVWQKRNGKQRFQNKKRKTTLPKVKYYQIVNHGKIQTPFGQKTLKGYLKTASLLAKIKPELDPEQIKDLPKPYIYIDPTLLFSFSTSQLLENFMLEQENQKCQLLFDPWLSCINLLTGKIEDIRVSKGKTWSDFLGKLPNALANSTLFVYYKNQWIRWLPQFNINPFFINQQLPLLAVPSITIFLSRDPKTNTYPEPITIDYLNINTYKNVTLDDLKAKIVTHTSHKKRYIHKNFINFYKDKARTHQVISLDKTLLTHRLYEGHSGQKVTILTPKVFANLLLPQGIGYRKNNLIPAIQKWNGKNRTATIGKIISFAYPEKQGNTTLYKPFVTLPDNTSANPIALYSPEITKQLEEEEKQFSQATPPTEEIRLDIQNYPAESLFGFYGNKISVNTFIFGMKNWTTKDLHGNTISYKGFIPESALLDAIKEDLSPADQQNLGQFSLYRSPSNFLIASTPKVQQNIFIKNQAQRQTIYITRRNAVYGFTPKNQKAFEFYFTKENAQWQDYIDAFDKKKPTYKKYKKQILYNGQFIDWNDTIDINDVRCNKAVYFFIPARVTVKFNNKVLLHIETHKKVTLESLKNLIIAFQAKKGITWHKGWIHLYTKGNKKLISLVRQNILDLEVDVKHELETHVTVYNQGYNANWTFPQGLGTPLQPLQHLAFKLKGWSNYTTEHVFIKKEVTKYPYRYIHIPLVSNLKSIYEESLLNLVYAPQASRALKNADVFMGDNRILFLNLKGSMPTLKIHYTDYEDNQNYIFDEAETKAVMHGYFSKEKLKDIISTKVNKMRYADTDLLQIGNLAELRKNKSIVLLPHTNDYLLLKNITLKAFYGIGVSIYNPYSPPRPPTLKEAFFFYPGGPGYTQQSVLNKLQENKYQTKELYYRYIKNKDIFIPIDCYSKYSSPLKELFIQQHSFITLQEKNNTQTSIDLGFLKNTEKIDENFAPDIISKKIINYRKGKSKLWEDIEINRQQVFLINKNGEKILTAKALKKALLDQAQTSFRYTLGNIFYIKEEGQPLDPNALGNPLFEQTQINREVLDDSTLVTEKDTYYTFSYKDSNDGELKYIHLDQPETLPHLKDLTDFTISYKKLRRCEVFDLQAEIPPIYNENLKAINYNVIEVETIDEETQVRIPYKKLLFTEDTPMALAYKKLGPYFNDVTDKKLMEISKEEMLTDMQKENEGFFDEDNNYLMPDIPIPNKKLTYRISQKKDKLPQKTIIVHMPLSYNVYLKWLYWFFGGLIDFANHEKVYTTKVTFSSILRKEDRVYQILNKDSIITGEMRNDFFYKTLVVREKAENGEIDNFPKQVLPKKSLPKEPLPKKVPSKEKLPKKPKRFENYISTINTKQPNFVRRKMSIQKLDILQDGDEVFFMPEKWQIETQYEANSLMTLLIWSPVILISFIFIIKKLLPSKKKAMFKIGVTKIEPKKEEPPKTESKTKKSSQKTKPNRKRRDKKSK